MAWLIFSSYNLRNTRLYIFAVKFENPLTNNQCLNEACLRTKEVYDLSPETKDHWEISHSEITLEKLIGSGNFGEVYFGYWNGTTEVAVKTMKHVDVNDDSFITEAQTMKMLKHKHIIPLFAVCTSKEPFYIITEYMDKGALLDLLRKKDPLISTFLDIINVIYQISYGMAYLEQNCLVHRDLAARNILVNKKKIVKIADFGLARKLEAADDIYEPNAQGKFPVKWTAPEVIDFRQYSSKSDVWSFGILMVEIFTGGQTPYKDWTNYETSLQVSQGYRISKPHTCPDNVYKDVILKCWHATPEERPTFFWLLEYFSNYDPENSSGYLTSDNVL